MIAIVSLCSLVFASDTKVTLDVVDGKGTAIPDAVAGMHWAADDHGLFEPPDAVKGDPLGRIVLETEKWLHRKAVFVQSSDRKLAGIAKVGPDDRGKTVRVTLQPLEHITGTFECKELATPPSMLITYVSLDGCWGAIVVHHTKRGRIDLRLPPEKYTLFTYGDRVEDRKQIITLESGNATHNLGTMELKPDIVAALKGKPAPELSITAARGIKSDLKLADLRGKYVYLEFWGYWCGPCVTSTLPELIAIHEANPDLRDKFVVLAIHDKDVTTFAELDAKLPRVKQQHWKGKDLPFPILLDKYGTTLKSYGVNGFPTGVLIDPNGNIVGKLPPAALAHELKLLKQKSATPPATKD